MLLLLHSSCSQSWCEAEAIAFLGCGLKEEPSVLIGVTWTDFWGPRQCLFKRRSLCFRRWICMAIHCVASRP